MGMTVERIKRIREQVQSTKEFGVVEATQEEIKELVQTQWIGLFNKPEFERKELPVELL